MRDWIRKFAALPILGLLLTPALPGTAEAAQAGKLVLGGEVTAEELTQAYNETFPRTLKPIGFAPTAQPDIFGPGAVLRAGNVAACLADESVAQRRSDGSLSPFPRPACR